MIDFYTVMEHIHHQITGVDALANLGKLHKLQLKTMSEGVAMTSFKVISPRFLSSTGSHIVIDSKASYFSYITTYAKWNDPLEGFKRRWKQELLNFRQAHGENIQIHLASSSPLYMLALSSLSESDAWVTGFINYIDETYNQYNGGKFGTKKCRGILLLNLLWH